MCCACGGAVEVRLPVDHERPPRSRRARSLHQDRPGTPRRCRAPEDAGSWPPESQRTADGYRAPLACTGDDPPRITPCGSGRCEVEILRCEAPRRQRLGKSSPAQTMPSPVSSSMNTHGEPW
jgi:hypothetical protein